ncbi:MAG: ribose-5-phosphate isomerase RpiA [Thermoplasmata archaeon]|uniref:Ribose-5-phosphate isomerase A n=1 Tax=Candidatus Sysuiplasma superficiale TaxID=2823368 RepID=A0A8J7YPR6_9ARCH|nr:ribose-5-phosphate isomerase RpiA [Candidatus Sysuiplasma superficiale]MBX8644457.1 ribose-5-phosphate isomerase RpiA [Candidatus Sysuiplasma superficiale]MCL4346579.1 ribose-5-phosphate isomerase RpiA [Candidatus Thermoplasmatota archaeon]MCL5437401.1 ribose-5-phosphate isomerase RpiA [Candidatus Thermoplasmatota archaeon]
MDKARKLAAEEAVRRFVRDGMIVGLGTGRTAGHAIRYIGGLVSEGLDVICIPTSEATASLAAGLGIKLSTLEEYPEINVTIDGADEVDSSLNLIKGRGGALLREKIVAAATETEVIVIDDQKVVGTLGSNQPVPVEMATFGYRSTMKHLAALSRSVVMRHDADRPFVTDNGNYVADCTFGGIPDPHKLENDIKSIPGALECGLFIGIAAAAVIGSLSGIRILTR